MNEKQLQLAKELIKVLELNPNVNPEKMIDCIMVDDKKVIFETNSNIAYWIDYDTPSQYGRNKIHRDYYDNEEYEFKATEYKDMSSIIKLAKEY